MNASMDHITKFITESNAIEGIHGHPTEASVMRVRDFLMLERPFVPDVCDFVKAEADAELRAQPWMNVSVGEHVAPRGGPEVVTGLEHLLDLIYRDDLSPFEAHVAYETLHPFMDGNGRSGRLLWAWQMVNHKHRPFLVLGFLHAFYYQTLEVSR